MNLKFNSEEELYQKLLPALRSKNRELKFAGFKMTEEDIWNLLKEHIWKNKKDLSISNIVNDIFSLTTNEIDSFINSN